MCLQRSLLTSIQESLLTWHPGGEAIEQPGAQDAYLKTCQKYLDLYELQHDAPGKKLRGLAHVSVDQHTPGVSLKLL